MQAERRSDRPVRSESDHVSMSEAAFLSRINIYPVKSLDGCVVDASPLLANGALRFDRAWALFDEKGQYVNGKRHAAVHRLRAETDLKAERLTLCDASPSTRGEARFQLGSDAADVEAWLSDYFGFPVFLKMNDDGGFPDDPASPGPTLISVASLREIARWFDLSLDETRRRFRANLEIDGVPPFWEDCLFGPAGTLVRFELGDVVLVGVNPCQRCIVPTRNPDTGLGDDSFVRRFIEHRRDALPASAPADRFNHFYKLAVNTRLGDAEGVGSLAIGARLTILDRACA
jgi:uncharacterized protein YcbX